MRMDLGGAESWLLYRSARLSVYLSHCVIGTGWWHCGMHLTPSTPSLVVVPCLLCMYLILFVWLMQVVPTVVVAGKQAMPGGKVAAAVAAVALALVPPRRWGAVMASPRSRARLPFPTAGLVAAATAAIRVAVVGLV